MKRKCVITLRGRNKNRNWRGRYLLLIKKKGNIIIWEIRETKKKWEDRYREEKEKEKECMLYLNVNSHFCPCVIYW